MQSGLLNDGFSGPILDFLRGGTKPTTTTTARGSTNSPTTQASSLPPAYQELLDRTIAEARAKGEIPPPPPFVDHNRGERTSTVPTDAMSNDTVRTTRTAQNEIIQQTQNTNAQNVALQQAITAQKAAEAEREAKKKQMIQIGAIGGAMIAAYFIFKRTK